MMTTTCPVLDPKGRFGITEASRVLGISPKTLRKRTTLSPRRGGVRFTIDKANGRMVFTGRALMDLYNLL